MDQVRDGDLIELHDGALWRDGEKLAAGEMLVADEIELRMEEARRTIGGELQKFARNTLEYIDSEAKITFEPLQLPPLRGEDPRPARAGRRARSRLRARSQSVARRTCASTGRSRSRSTVAPTRCSR